MATLPPATWTQLAHSKRLYRSSQALSVVGQKVYIFGGELVPREPVDNKVDVVHFGDSQGKDVETISPTAEAPQARVGSPSTTINGDIYIFSGRGGLEMKPIEEEGSLWRYTVANGQWSPIKPSGDSAYPVGRSYHCITSNGVDCIYVHAGCPESGRLSDLWQFSISEKTWKELPSPPSPPRGGASITFAKGALYRMNGFDGKTEQGGSVDVFDLAAGSWSTINYEPDGVKGPQPRSVSTFLPMTIQGTLYLLTMFGERDPSALGHAGAGKMQSDVWAFDVEKKLWQKIQAGNDSPVGRGWFDADVAKDATGSDMAVVHGGIDEGNTRLGDVWALSFPQ